MSTSTVSHGSNQGESLQEHAMLVQAKMGDETRVVT